jgi:hypothetical protein
VKNLEDAKNKTDLLAALKEDRQHLKDLLFHEGRGNFRVLDPNVDIQAMARLRHGVMTPFIPSQWRTRRWRRP